MISVHKKVDDMEINCHFYPIVCYIYLLNVFWGFGSFTVVDIPYNKNIIYLFIVFGPPWTRKHRHVPRMPVHKSGPEYVCARVWEREGETGSHHSGVSFLNRGLCVNTYEHHHCLSRDSVPVSVFTFILKFEARDYGKGCYISECLWCSANHNALCQLANQSRLCLSEGGTL